MPQAARRSGDARVVSIPRGQSSADLAADTAKANFEVGRSGAERRMTDWDSLNSFSDALFLDFVWV